MEQKLRQLLLNVIEDVIKTGEPIGSQRLVEEYGMEVSSATIRNWFAELEDLGYLTQPYTSSGRLPTEQGYQFYVDELMPKRSVTKKDCQAIESANAGSDDFETRVKESAKCIASAVDNAVIVGLHKDDTYYTGLTHLFAQPEFTEMRNVINLGALLDSLDEMIGRVKRQEFVEPTIKLGSQCPFGSMCGSVMVTLDKGVFFAILGPTRLDYPYAKALLVNLKNNLR